MVPGIDSFREKFKDYTDYYTIIGGTACDILLSEADLPFRATKDIDMILIMEDNFPEFAAIFWEYIKEGGYKCGWKNEENMHFYRFTELCKEQKITIAELARRIGQSRQNLYKKLQRETLSIQSWINAPIPTPIST